MSIAHAIKKNKQYNNIETVFNNKLWVQAPTYFNDPFDCEIVLYQDYIKQNCISSLQSKEGFMSGSAMWNELNRIIDEELTLFQKTLEESRNQLGVACFSEQDDSILMWSHYADNHRGFCVEYNMLEAVQTIQYTFVPVLYSNKKKLVDNVNLLEPDIFAKQVTIYSIDSLFRKAKDWEYEKEWRIIRDEAACGLAWNKNKNGALIDFIKPQSIILGCMIDNNSERKIQKLCRERNIPLFKMEKNKYEFRLEKRKMI